MVELERPQRWQQPPWGMSQERTLTMDNSKTCIKCGQSKPKSLFSKHAKNSDGLQRHCKECNKSYYLLNKDRIDSRNKKHYDENPDYYANWRQVNAEKRKQFMEAYWPIYSQKNSESRNAKSRDFYQENKSRILRRQKAYNDSHREQISERSKTYRRLNPEVLLLTAQRRRARVRNSSIYLVTTKELKNLYEKPCFYCGAQSEHIDHIVPLSRGGEHRIGNLLGACARCNLSKGSKFITEWKKGERC
jgi:5-methylcytosine-specific restriction endonuclease McrA